MNHQRKLRCRHFNKVYAMLPINNTHTRSQIVISPMELNSRVFRSLKMEGETHSPTASCALSSSTGWPSTLGLQNAPLFPSDKINLMKF